jgi:hypothetical protein
MDGLVAVTTDEPRHGIRPGRAGFLIWAPAVLRQKPIRAATRNLQRDNAPRSDVGVAQYGAARDLDS